MLKPISYFNDEGHYIREPFDSSIWNVFRIESRCFDGKWFRHPQFHSLRPSDNVMDVHIAMAKEYGYDWRKIRIMLVDR